MDARPICPVWTPGARPPEWLDCPWAGRLYDDEGRHWIECLRRDADSVTCPEGRRPCEPPIQGPVPVEVTRLRNRPAAQTMALIAAGLAVGGRQ